MDERRIRDRVALCVLVALTGFLLAADVASAKEGRDLGVQVDAVAQPYVDGDVFVGVVIGIVKDGERRVFAYGRLGEGASSKPGPDTVFEIGSITKVFTGILLADLVREGKIRLDQPVQELLPEGVTMPRHGDRQVTLLHLTTHTSGLPRMPTNFQPADSENPYADYDEARLYAYLNDASLSRAPGATYEYSNLGAGLLGTVLARASGSTYEALLRTRVLEPLMMKSTSIALSEDQRRRLAPGHTADLVPAANWDLDAFAGAGALRSTVGDMLLFLEANLAKEGPIQEALQAAREIHHAPEGDGPRMGLGWHAGKRGRGRWHNGGTGGYHSFLAVRPERGVGVVVLSNTSTGRVDALGNAVVRLLLGDEVPPPKIRSVVEIDPAVLDDYRGTYRLAPTFDIVVTREKNRLFIQATGQPKVAVYPTGKDRFFLRVVEAEIQFERGEEGQVAGLVLFQNGRQIPGQRQP